MLAARRVQRLELELLECLPSVRRVSLRTRHTYPIRPMDAAQRPVALLFAGRGVMTAERLRESRRRIRWVCKAFDSICTARSRICAKRLRHGSYDAARNDLGRASRQDQAVYGSVFDGAPPALCVWTVRRFEPLGRRPSVRGEGVTAASGHGACSFAFIACHDGAAVADDMR